MAGLGMIDVGMFWLIYPDKKFTKVNQVRMLQENIILRDMFANILQSNAD